MASTNNQIKDITDEIIKGIQNGSMAVENIHVRWDGTMQRYELQILDIGRTSRLAQFAPTPVVPKWSSFPPFSDVVTPIPAIKDLGTITEPVIGFRDFHLGIGPSFPMPGLVSRNKAPWPMRESMRAFCREGALSKHDAPNIDCQCGIYAFSSPKDDGLLTGAVIWGEIAMWGEVLIAPYGYRSEFAYPKTLFIADTGAKKSLLWLRDHLADGYGVPVFIVEQKQGKMATEIISEMIEAGL